MKQKEFFLTIRVRVSAEDSMESLEEMRTRLVASVSPAKAYKGKKLYIQETELTDIEEKDAAEFSDRKQNIENINAHIAEHGRVTLSEHDEVYFRGGVAQAKEVDMNGVYDEDDEFTRFDDLSDDIIAELAEIIANR